MSIRVVLVQHGEAVPEETDPERPLTELGRADLERLGSFLASFGFSTPRIFHSGKLRAHDSARIIAAKLGGTMPIEALDRISPKDSPVWLSELVGTWTEGALIVGHQPFLSRFVDRLLLGEEQPPIIDFTPATAVCMQRRGASKAWAIAWALPPELLRPRA